MKKTITVLSVIAIAFVIIFTCLSFLTAFGNVKTYTERGMETSSALDGAILTSCITEIVWAVIDILLCLYLIFWAEKSKGFAAEIVFAVLRFFLLPILGQIFSTVRIYVLQFTHFSSQDYAVYSAFTSGLNTLTVLNMSTVLIIFALAFSVAEKALKKKAQTSF